LRGPSHLIKTDFNAPVWREKEICFPNTISVSHGSVDSPGVGALWSGPCQSPSGNIGIGSLAGTLLGIWGCAWGKDCFSCRVHLPVSPLSTLWIGPCQWAWVRARFWLMSWVSTLEAGFRGLFVAFFGWVFWAFLGHLILEDWG
jgi:hypothetical protein